MAPEQPYPFSIEEDDRTMFIFTPPAGGTWRLDAGRFTEALRRREGENAFVHTKADGGAYGPRSEHSWWFDFTVAGVTHEGIGAGAAGDHEGVSLKDATAAVAAEFAHWVCEELLPPGAAVEFNSEIGLEAGLDDGVLTQHTVADLEAVFRGHLADL
ncbi:hypothetical protein [Kitasatospora sp. NPDC008115]|uniref:hypothetical protein n=1 Tax=Kitasatospora sp. NPDC008115 TaxID=3364022 RepID=UPI0036E38B20